MNERRNEDDRQKSKALHPSMNPSVGRLAHDASMAVKQHIYKVRETHQVKEDTNE